MGLGSSGLGRAPTLLMVHPAVVTTKTAQDSHEIEASAPPPSSALAPKPLGF